MILGDVPEFMIEMGFSPTVKDRLIRRLVRNDEGCMEYEGARYADGYGAIALGGKMRRAMQASRVAWMLSTGTPIPQGIYVCHKCDNPPCCNPKHLFLGTPQRNVDDKIQKRRQPSHVGSSNPRAKLTEYDVLTIRDLAAQGASYAQIGRRLGISSVQARNVATGRSWAHVAGNRFQSHRYWGVCDH